MEEEIIINGIRTNNLKNIDIKLKKRSINLIIGPSGSGKSSLAYETIAQIGLHELSSMYQDTMEEPQYKIDSYKNMVPTVPIKQLNNNNNVRSTIGTYFNINQYLANIFSSVLNLPYEYFILNKPENVCQSCHGIGYTKKIDITKVIDYDTKIQDIPVKCWNKNKDFYREILIEYCNDNKIDYTKKLCQLNKKDQIKIIFGQSEKKYIIKYRSQGHYSTRKTSYQGVMTEKPMLLHYIPNDKYFSEVPCSFCKGEKFSEDHNKYKINGKSIGEILCLPFSELNKWLKQIKSVNDFIHFSLQQINMFIEKTVELNIGYLYLNRTIPSLSGGELQRLRLVQVFNTQLTDLLIVLDEPLAGLSSSEKEIVFENIQLLSKKHTILVVDHHSIFYKSASNIITLGKGSGKYGGNVINTSEYIQSQSNKFKFKIIKSTEQINVNIKNEVYKYKGVNIAIAKNALTLITGNSGVGKSTLLREYFPQFFENYTYINQKPILGNVHSFVVTDLDIFNNVIEYFAKNFNKRNTFFSNLTSSEGVCPVCKGKGYLSFGTDYEDKITFICKDCNGTGFNKKLNKFQIKGKNIFDVWNMTIDEGIIYFNDNDKITSILSKAQNLLLGHLQLGQLTSSLSGGENLRIKLLKSLVSSTVVYGIDEPFKGLNNYEIYEVALFLSNLATEGKTVVVVDHEEEGVQYFNKRIDLVDKGGYLVDKKNN